MPKQIARIMLLAVPLFLLAFGDPSLSQEKVDKKDKEKDPPAAKVKGFLPQNWGKLGLSDDQKQRIYKVQAKHQDELDKLEAKIKEIRADRQKEMESVLTADQKKELLRILTGKAGVDTKDK